MCVKRTGIVHTSIGYCDVKQSDEEGVVGVSSKVFRLSGLLISPILY